LKQTKKDLKITFTDELPDDMNHLSLEQREELKSAMMLSMNGEKDE